MLAWTSLRVFYIQQAIMALVGVLTVLPGLVLLGSYIYYNEHGLQYIYYNEHGLHVEIGLGMMEIILAFRVVLKTRQLVKYEPATLRYARVCSLRLMVCVGHRSISDVVKAPL
jgi:hypothetical protein